MTKRQREIAGEMQAMRDDIIAFASTLPIGHSAQVRIPCRCFLPFVGLPMNRMVTLMRDGDAVRYQEAAPVRRKGWHAPRWRTLGRVELEARTA